MQRKIVIPAAVTIVGALVCFHFISPTVPTKKIQQSEMEDITIPTAATKKSNIDTKRWYIFQRNDTRILGNSPVNDFRRFPCAFGSNPTMTADQSNDRTCVRTVSASVEDTPHDNCVPMRYPSINVSLPICVYDSSFDGIISKYLRDTSQWEPELVTSMMQYILTNPKLELLDLGCNVGVYTMVAAKLGKRVVCVDPMVPNVMMVSTSLKLGKIRPNVTVIWNAVSDTRRLVSLKPMEGNVGGTEIRDTVAGNSDLAETITMDDLLPFFKGKEIVIKMDIQEQELAALRGGELFFSNVDIKLIQIEYHLHRNLPSGPEIITVLARRGFNPYKDISGKVPLNKNDVKNWPFDVYFRKDK